ncbi:regulator of G-protein signaling 9-binding protein B-like [Rhinatrema bivittatum]|uniref:regulator of G-protein signaling 9-binding protein B-like n=1 Tax=Rhinatrema bivittatum TaxID=194408 RepID=UPI00112A0706|nr:regulator of G-protein signaling 9-binding protein B-like [Rhinatrema bivittatum]
MPLQNIRVTNEDSVNSLGAREECKVLVMALNKVIACYRHLATSVGGSSDSRQLRNELKWTREKVLELAGSNRNKLTTTLRDKQLAKEERAELECLWVLFSSCLELFHADMCKVFELRQAAPLDNSRQSIIQTGLTGTTSEIASRALSVSNIISDETVIPMEQKDLGDEIAKVDRMIYDMEMKVNVLRWTVEATADMCDGLVTSEFSSVALLSMEGEENRPSCDRGQLFVSLVLCAVILVVMTLTVCVVHLA